MIRHPSELVTARALGYGLDPGQTCDAVVGDLVRLARDDRRVLELALARVERALAARWSRVGTRAHNAIEQAIASVAVDR